MLRNRIRSNSGATILLALLFFLLCAMAGSIILSAGSAAAGRISGLKESEQAFYSVTSAAQVMRDEIEGQEFQAYTEDGGKPIYTVEPDSKIAKILMSAVKAVYEDNQSKVEETFTIRPQDSQKNVLGTVTANLIMTDDYKIEITFNIESSEKYVCRLTAKAIVNRTTTRYEEEKEGQLVEIERQDLQVYWNECTIDKG
ncbi:hypothetical protein [Emergencia sp.]|uniref:hypothetical protein n=1 Tax=Emergencia sp. TaxID=1926557 RepID=UPI003AF1886C